MLLNSAELAGLLQLPTKDVYSQKLIIPRVKTVPTLEVALSAELILGQNIHRVKITIIRLSEEHGRHQTNIIRVTLVQRKQPSS